MKLFMVISMLAVILSSCDKSSKTEKVNLSAVDLVASNNMSASLSALQQSLNSLKTAATTSDRLYWDNLYHQHDSTFWVHHDHYHHETYPHDDHHHQWVLYDPTVNHHHHHHHPYPHHPHDSLVIIHNTHHTPHHNTDHHFPGHHWNQHHVLDSLHLIHNLYHP